MILDRLANYQDCSSSEEILRDYILNNPDKVVNMSIQKLSEETLAAPSSIVRFSKKLGFEGYTALKVELASTLCTFRSTNRLIGSNLPITQTMDDREIMEAILNLNYQSLRRTQEILDLVQLRRIANKISESDVVTLWGQGPSLIAAESLHYKLRRIGIYSVLESKSGFNTTYKKKNNLKQVALIISNYAESELVSRWVNDLKKQGVYTILLTANRLTKLRHLVDEVIYIENFEEKYCKVGPFYSRASMEFVLDTIFLYVFSNDYETNIKQLNIDELAELKRTI